VLSAESFGSAIIGLLIEHVPTLSGGEIGAIRRHMTDLADRTAGSTTEVRRDITRPISGLPRFEAARDDVLPDPGAGTSGLPDEDEFATASPGALCRPLLPGHRGLALPGRPLVAAADGWGFISSPAGPTTREPPAPGTPE